MYRPKKIVMTRSGFLQDDLHPIPGEPFKNNTCLCLNPDLLNQNLRRGQACVRKYQSGSDSHLWLRTIGLGIFLDNRQKKTVAL